VEKAAELKLKPPVLGHLIAFQLQDGSSLVRFGSRLVKPLAPWRSGFRREDCRDGSQATLLRRVPDRYGIRRNRSSRKRCDRVDGTGDVVGAVGVTGDLSDNDGARAMKGVVASGLAVKD
jgi:hypothetical protein